MLRRIELDPSNEKDAWLLRVFKWAGTDVNSLSDKMLWDLYNELTVGYRIVPAWLLGLLVRFAFALANLLEVFVNPVGLYYEAMSDYNFWRAKRLVKKTERAFFLAIKYADKRSDNLRDQIKWWTKED